MVIDKVKDTEYKYSVRTLLGLDREDTITLPDADIDDMAILDMAEIDILSTLPSTADLTDKRIRLSVIYTVAALLCPSMPSRVEVEVKGIDSGWKKKSVDYRMLAENLLGQASTLLTPIIENVGGDSSLFKIAPTRRANEAQRDRFREEVSYSVEQSRYFGQN